MLGFVGGTYYFGIVVDFDPTAMVFGVLDPAIAYSLGALAIAAAGAVAGSAAGGIIWNLVRSSAQAGFKIKEKKFLERVKKNRVIPTGQAVQAGGQAIDWYGEKVTSVNGYRKWLQTQRKVGSPFAPLRTLIRARPDVEFVFVGEQFRKKQQFQVFKA